MVPLTAITIPIIIVIVRLSLQLSRTEFSSFAFVARLAVCLHLLFDKAFFLFLYARSFFFFTGS